MSDIDTTNGPLGVLITRRDFLISASTVAVVVGASVGGCLPQGEPDPPHDPGAGESFGSELPPTIVARPDASGNDGNVTGHDQAVSEGDTQMTWVGGHGRTLKLVTSNTGVDVVFDDPVRGIRDRVSARAFHLGRLNHEVRTGFGDSIALEALRRTA